MKQKTTPFFLFILMAIMAAFSAQAAGISGLVWSDANANGLQDAGEPGLDGVFVLLENESGLTFDISITANGGAYQFVNISAGKYRVKFANPGGLWQSPQNVGNDDTVDSDPDIFGYSPLLTLGNADNLDLDAGFSMTPNGCFTPITLNISNIICDDNGTPSNPADDTFSFTVTASGGTGPWGWDYPAANISMYPYGQPIVFGPYQVSNGLVSFTIIDHDSPNCTAQVLVFPPSCNTTPPPPDTVCDEKVKSCIKYQLLGISLDADQNKVYRIRVTNNCSAKMIYTAFQVPNGINAESPANNSTYTAPSGRNYKVRNPNFSPFYSVRFSSITDSISNGQSDVFVYSLPPQASPTFINVTTRVATKVFYQATLNTFDCVITDQFGNQDAPAGLISDTQEADLSSGFLLYPNPADHTLWIDWSEQGIAPMTIRIYNAQGQVVLNRSVAADAAATQRLELASSWANGIYFCELSTENGARFVKRFAVQR